MKFTQIPSDTFSTLQMNAGIICKTFAPETGTVSDIIGATTGGVTFSATPTFVDLGDDIDNCPKNMKELKVLDTWEAKMSGTFATISAALAKTLTGAATASADKITPNNDLSQSDFADLWWVGDYSDKNSSASGGFCAIHLKNALNTAGFQIKTSDKAKGNFSFEFTGHYSISDQDKVPFEIYVKSGT